MPKNIRKPLIKTEPSDNNVLFENAFADSASDHVMHIEELEELEEHVTGNEEETSPAPEEEIEDDFVCLPLAGVEESAAPLASAITAPTAKVRTSILQTLAVLLSLMNLG